MLRLSRVRRVVVVVAAGALVAVSVGSSVPVLALSDGSQSSGVAVEQAEIDTGSSFGAEGPVVAGVSGNFASVLAPKITGVFDRSNTLGTGVTPQVAAGASHTCALLNTGAVNCWGRNGNGRLGNGSTTNSSAPVAVNAFTVGSATAVSITAGALHTCALLNTGAVNCWGYNSAGQLGDGSTTNRLAPVAVNAFTVGSATAVSITAGYNHTCALLNTGAVNCWGYNGDGQLGNGSTADSLVPVAVSAFIGGVTAVSITAGGFHTCALLNTGAVNCWGYNGFGQLGNGSSADSSAPVAVNAFTVGSATAVSITAGYNHTCALLNTGAVNCWGYNGSGQLGDGTTNQSSAPVAVSAFTGGVTAVSITAGGSHTCALLNTGAVNCWGYNGDGRLGNGTTNQSSAPVAVSAFTGGVTAVSITAGDFHTCAVLNTGAVNCWGSNSAGQLGDGSTTGGLVPAKAILFVLGASTAVTATAGDSEVVVSWTAPASDGGSVISSYTVTSLPDNKTCTTTGALTCTVVGLTNATAYTFTVTATNSAGAGPASTASGQVTPVTSVASVTVPGAPTAVTATAGDSEVVVSWTAPASDGGSVISSYTVTSLPDNKTCTTTGALTCTVVGLTNATAYTFTVTATNSAGAGPASTASGTVTPVASLVALTQSRLLDTRSGPNDLTVDGSFEGIGRRGAGTTLELTVAGRGGVPNDAGAVMLNVTAVSPGAPGFLTVFPCANTMPLASSVNYGPGDVVANAVLAKIGAGGKVCIYSLAAIDIVVDVTGYIAAG